MRGFIQVLGPNLSIYAPVDLPVHLFIHLYMYVCVRGRMSEWVCVGVRVDTGLSVYISVQTKIAERGRLNGKGGAHRWYKLFKNCVEIR